MQLYREKIAIAEIEGRTSEQMQLQAELDKRLVQFEKEKLDNITEHYKNLRKINENKSKNLSNSLDELEARGLIATNRLYEEQKTLNDEKKKSLEAELVLIERQHDKIEAGTQEWYDSLDSIQACKDEIAGCVMNAVELGDAIRNINWHIFDKISSRIDLLSSEYDLAIEIMSEKNLTDKDTGNFTSEGTTTLGAYFSELLLAQEKAGEFKQTLDEMKKHIDNGDDGYADQKALDEYYGKYEEYIDLIKSEHGIRQNIIDLMRQKYQVELDYLQDIINKRKELLQAEKDAYDYQRSIEEKTKNVAVIAKQMTALGGDDSEAAKTRIQQLQVSLDEANKDLQDAEYNQWLSDQQTMLDNLYNEYSDFIDDKLNDTDALIQEAVTYLSNINVGESVGECLNDYYDKYGYDPTEDFKNITNELGENGSIVKAIGNAVTSIITHSERQQRYQAKADDVETAISEIGNVFEDVNALQRYTEADRAYHNLSTSGDNGESIQSLVGKSSVSALKTKGDEVNEVRKSANEFNSKVYQLGSFDDKSVYTAENGTILQELYDMYNALSTSGKALAKNYKDILDSKKLQYDSHGNAVLAEQEAAAQRAQEEAVLEEQRKATARASFTNMIKETYQQDARLHGGELKWGTSNLNGNGSTDYGQVQERIYNNGLTRADKPYVNAAWIEEACRRLGYNQRNAGTLLNYMNSIGFANGGIAETLQKVPSMNGDDGWVTLKKGEGILTPEQTQQFIKLVRGLDTLNPAVDMVKNLSKMDYEPVSRRSKY